MVFYITRFQQIHFYLFLYVSIDTTFIVKELLYINKISIIFTATSKSVTTYITLPVYNISNNIIKQGNLTGWPTSQNRKDHFGPNLGLLDPNLGHNSSFLSFFF